MHRSAERRGGRTPPSGPPSAADAAMAAALARPAGATSHWVLLEGPPGRGATAAIDRALAAAKARELRTARVSGRELRTASAAILEALVADLADAEAVGVEDVQWLGADLLARLERGPAVVVASLRTGVPVTAPAELAYVRARAELVALTTLTPDEVRDTLIARGLDPEPWLVERVVALTSGSPLMVSRLHEHLAEHGPRPRPADFDVAVTGVLPRVARFCDAHFAHCGPDVHALIDAVLVLGDDVPLWLAGDAAGLTREAAAEAAAALGGSGVLASADPLQRAMPLAWDAMAASRPALRHDDLRRRAARLLARTAEGAGPAADLLLAAPPSGEEWAASVLREAAATALDAGDSELALTRLERAAVEPAPDLVRGTLLVELGDARDRAGHGDPIAAYRQALRVVPAADRPPIHLRLGRSLYGAGDYRGAALELDRGLALAPPDAPVTIELLAAYVASARFDRTLEDAAAEHLAPVLDRSGSTRTPAERALLAEVSLERGIRGMPRSTVVRIAMRAWADGLLLEGADPYGITLSQVAAALTWSDAFTESIEVLTATVAHAERVGETQLASTARYLRAWPRYYTGALDEAEADVRAALDAPGWEMYEPSARAILGHVLFERGDLAGAEAILVMANPEPWERTIPYAMLLETRSRLHAERGDLASAASDLAHVGELLDSIGNQSPFCPWRSRLGVVTAMQGDAVTARELIALELEQAQDIGTPRAIGFALQARGRVGHLTEGDGVPDLEAAAEALAACGARIEHARTLTALGAALTDLGRRDDARARLRTAAELAASVGAREIAERAERELRRAGGRDRSAGSAARPGGLTASELRVARLAARGMTNREIAAELVVSAHTVRFHLAAVYRKLGVTERPAIADRLRRHDEPR